MPRIDRQELAAIFAGGAVGAVAARLARPALRQRPATAGRGRRSRSTSPARSRSAYFATRLQERLPQSTYRRPLLGTGFCGAYTTFSTMQVEILKIIDAHRYGLAAGYALASIAAGYAAIWLASALVRRTG